MTTLIQPAPQVARDRWGRPLITLPDGSGTVAYTRATTLAGAVDDLQGLMTWKQSLTALGIVDNPEFQVAISAHRDDKKELNKIVKDAFEAGGGTAAATVGTAIHAFTEQIDRGTPPVNVPVKYQADLDAYVEATKDLTALHIEQMSVIDSLKVAGTPDRIVEYDGNLYVADLKTGSINFPHKIALQLALYARAKRYDIATGERSPWHPTRDVDLERAIIIHLAAGTGVCELVWVDIAAGWEAVDLAIQVRDWRKRRDLCTPLTTAVAPPILVTDHEAGINRAALENKVATAKTVEELRTLWADNQIAWGPDLTALAAARKVLLEQKLVS